MRKYALAIDLILLFTCLLILVIDLKIKDELIQQAIKLEGKLSEQRGCKGNADIHRVVPGYISDSDVPMDTPVSSPDHAANSTGARRPRKRNTATANGSAGNPDQGIPGASDTVGS